APRARPRAALAPQRYLADHAHPVRIRRRLRGAVRTRPGGERVRLRPDGRGNHRVRTRRPGRPRTRGGRLRRHHRRGTGRDGGGEPRREGCRGYLGRPRPRTTLRTGDARLRRPRGALPVLLRARDDVRQVRTRVPRPAGRVRYPRRTLRGAHPRADREGAPVPDRAHRHEILGRDARVAPRRPRRGGNHRPDRRRPHAPDRRPAGSGGVHRHRPARDEEARGTRRYRSRRAALGGERPRGPVSADAWVTALTLAAAGATGAVAVILTRTGTKIGL